MKKVVNFTVHKNTRDQRKAHQLRKNLLKEARYCSQIEDIDGFAIVAFSKDSALSSWEVKDGNAFSLPDRARTVLLKDVVSGNFESTD